MVTEDRAQRLDLLARAKFAKPREQIEESRALAEERVEIAETADVRAHKAAASLQQAAAIGEVEVG